MFVKQARALARQWVMAEAHRIPGFYGAFFHGSILWLKDEDILPDSSDVDVMVVLDGADPTVKSHKFRYQDLLLEISYLPRERVASPAMVLGQYNLAGSFRVPGIILDPSGQLTRLQAAVSRDYARRRWVYKRCEDARDKVLRYLRSVDAAEVFHAQVMGLLFAAGLTTHVLLVAGLKNPTVRRRYAAVRELLVDYGYADFHETLLALLGCERLNRERVDYHLAALAEVFDATCRVVRSPFPFAGDIRAEARSTAVDGSQALIEQGAHREAMFWIAVTYSRCVTILYHDAPEAMQTQFNPGFRLLLDDLGLTSLADIQQRGQQIRDRLPQIWQVAEAIMVANPEIEDEPEAGV